MRAPWTERPERCLYSAEMRHCRTPLNSWGRGDAVPDENTDSRPLGWLIALERPKEDTQAMAARGKPELDPELFESGSRPAIARSPGNEAHAEMERAVFRGDCVIVTDVTASDGFRLQWSIWRNGDEMCCQAWHFTLKSGWTRGPSFVIAGTPLQQLLLLMNGT